ncbi:MAG: hypothetical protein ACRDF8_04300, partial [Chloroflexota bacterium]
MILEACGGTAAPASNASAPASGSGSNAYPTYTPYANKPKPDYPSIGPLYEDGYDNYPANPVKSVATPPGKGSDVSIFSIGLFPPPNPLDQNPAWKAVNKDVNANIKFNIVSITDYATKMSTTMAGGTSGLPDLIFFYTPPGASSAIGSYTGAPEFITGAMADLTPYLAGNAAKDYPNLAAIPTNSWKSSGSVYQGKLWMVPIHR